MKLEIGPKCGKQMYICSFSHYVGINCEEWDCC